MHYILNHQKLQTRKESEKHQEKNKLLHIREYLEDYQQKLCKPEDIEMMHSICGSDWTGLGCWLVSNKRKLNQTFLFSFHAIFDISGISHFFYLPSDGRALLS